MQRSGLALEDALLGRFGLPPDRDTGVVLRTDNALMYAPDCTVS